MNMAVVVEQESTEQEQAMKDYENSLRSLIGRGKLQLCAFYPLQVARQSTEEDEDHEELLRDFTKEHMLRLGRVCTEMLGCKSCGRAFKFRPCRSPREDREDARAIEWSCEGCGDHFTLVEDRDGVSFMNLCVLRKIDHLRWRGRGLSVHVVGSGLEAPAILRIGGEKPSLFIDLRRVRKAETVQAY